MRLAPAAKGIHDELPDVGCNLLVVRGGCVHLGADALVGLVRISPRFCAYMQSCQRTLRTLAPSSLLKPPPMRSVAGGMADRLFPYASSASARMRATVRICWFSCTPCWSFAKRTPRPGLTVSTYAGPGRGAGFRPYLRHSHSTRRTLRIRYSWRRSKSRLVAQLVAGRGWVSGKFKSNVVDGGRWSKVGSTVGAGKISLGNTQAQARRCSVVVGVPVPRQDSESGGRWGGRWATGDGRWLARDWRRVTGDGG